MMHQPIGKKTKIYFYLVLLILFSTSFNINLSTSIKKEFRIKKIQTDDNYLDDNFEINYNKCKSVSVGSLNTYYSTKKIKSVKYLNYEQFIKNEK